MSETTFRILLLPGDGVGPEVVAEARATLDAVATRGDFSIDYSHALIGGAAIDAHGVPLRPEDAELAEQSDAILLGAVGGPKWDALPREKRPEFGLLGLRKRLDLFANIRPVRVFDALVDVSPIKADVVRGVDLMIVRELTGGLYFGKPSNAGPTHVGDGQSTHSHTASRRSPGWSRSVTNWRQHGARRSPASTRLMCFRPPSSGVPSRPKSPPSTLRSPPNTPWSIRPR